MDDDVSVMFERGCVLLSDGDVGAACGIWMDLADSMEDEGDLEELIGAVAGSIACAMLTWTYPVTSELRELGRLSFHISPLVGGTDSVLMVRILERLLDSVSADDQGLNMKAIQAASAAAYQVVMGGRDIREMRLASGLILDVFDAVSDSVRASGEVPECMDSLPLEELRRYFDDRLVIYRTIVSEYDAVVGRFTDDEVDGIVRRWRGPKGERLIGMMKKAFDLGVVHSETGNRSYLDRCRRETRMYVLKYMGIRR